MLNIQTTSTTQTMGNRMLDLAKLLNIGGDDPGPLVDEVLGLLSQKLAGAGLDIGDQFGDLSSDLAKELTDPEPSTSTESAAYTVYITADRFRLDAGDIRIHWRPGEMSYTDPGTGQMRHQALTHVDSRVVHGAEHTGASMTVSPTGGSPEMHAGYMAYPHEYSYELGIPTMGDGQAAVSIVNEVTGTAWIAFDVPEHAQIAAFYRNFASAFGDKQGMMGGQSATMVRLTEHGVPLKTKETTRTFYMEHVVSAGAVGKMEVMRGEAEAIVTEISHIPLEEAFPEEAAPSAGASEDEQPGAPQPNEPEPCDCSCAGFEELKQLEEDDPNAMGKAMCAQECAMKWALACQE